MKKLIAILLCLVMVVSMVACGGEKNPPPTDEKVITIGVFEPTSGQNGAGGKKKMTSRHPVRQFSVSHRYHWR